MNEQNRHHRNQYENVSLLSLILAYFVPIYIRNGKADINTNMVSVYATRYMLRNSMGALLTFSIGEVLIRADQIIIGETFTGLFVIFTGLCSVFLCAMVEARKTN